MEAPRKLTKFLFNNIDLLKADLIEMHYFKGFQ